MTRLENLSLLLLNETDAMPLWLERWSYSYPTVAAHNISGSQTIAQWQNQITQVFATLCTEDHVFVVAHGIAANAVAAWYYQTDIATQKRLAGIMLVSPLAQGFADDKLHTFQRVRFNQPTALVIGQNDEACPEDWARQQAALWHARLLIAPQAGHLNGTLDGWQWGMKLMQEMILNP